MTRLGIHIVIACLAIGAHNYAMDQSVGVYTYALCDAWERIYIAEQVFEVSDGKFVPVETRAIPVKE